ncbi:MAG: hypothetical protein ACE15B_15430 [Bryobacteraceae bacterium]
MKLLLIAFVAVVSAIAQVQNGVQIGPVPSTVTPNGMNFDPPCLFADTLPLASSLYLNPKSKAYFATGNGSVLNECSNFQVTGYSAPNFLAWNCNSANFDGTVPKLPEFIGFTGLPVTSVQVKVGSSTDAGKSAALVAFNANFTVIAQQTVTLQPALQLLSTMAKGTAFVAIYGPCIMVADDLSYN